MIKPLQSKYDKRHDVMHIYFKNYSYIDDANEEYSNIYVFRNEFNKDITKILVIDFKRNEHKLKELFPQYDINFNEVI